MLNRKDKLPENRDKALSPLPTLQRRAVAKRSGRTRRTMVFMIRKIVQSDRWLYEEKHTAKTLGHGELKGRFLFAL